MEETALEWFSEQLLNLDIEFDSVLISRSNYWIKRNNIVEQAKEMEKEQLHKYAEFAVICDRKKLPVLEFDGFIKL